jgi:hypothetical protein
MRYRSLLTLYKFSYSNNTLTSTVTGSYSDTNPLANITIAGLTAQPSGLSMSIGGIQLSTDGISQSYTNGTLMLTGLSSMTESGAWSENLQVSFTSGMETVTTSGAVRVSWNRYSWSFIVLTISLAILACL